MFRPRSVALIGASTEKTKISGRPLRFFREFGYQGSIYPVNPKYEEIDGLKCFASINDIPGEVDLAVITLPASAVPPALESCGAKGVKAAAIISSGFAEVGAEGARLQEELQQTALRYGMALCGPNCSGFVYVPHRVTASFTVGIDDGFPKDGPLAFISQSGALSSYILGAARDRGVGFRYWITTGNECVLSFTDYLEYILMDPQVRLVLGYLEDARNGGAFQAAARKALIQDKPLIVMKVGRSEVGAKASLSHTGSLAGADAVYQAVFDKHGILRADTLDELFDLAAIAQSSRRPPGKRTQVLSISGAAGILMADVGSELGLEFPDLSPSTKEALRAIMPPFASLTNPMDVTAEAVSRPGLLKQAAEVVVKDFSVDNLVVFFGIVPGAHERLARDMAEVARHTEKLVAVAWYPLPDPEIWQGLASCGVPVFPEPARAIRALAKMTRYVAARDRALSPQPEPSRSDFQQKTRAAAVLDKVRAAKRSSLTETEAKELLRTFGFTIPRGRLARDVGEAQALAASMDGPVVLKASSPDILHKTEAGVVRLGVQDGEEVAAAFAEIQASAKAWNPAAQLTGVLVEEMIQARAREVIVGMHQDQRFGPVVTFGLGGTLVEALRDFAVSPAPVTLDEAHEMIRRVRGYRILTAFRGLPAADIDALADAICRIGELASQWGEQISELEINPLFVLPKGGGVVAGDALAVLR
jgi:acetate---CoA ligase (ADP-forming)